jgi:hypothetical protein
MQLVVISEREDAEYAGWRLVLDHLVNCTTTKRRRMS